MKNCIAKNFILNNNILLCSEYEKSFSKEGISIYEVIRVIDDNPLFCEEHLYRLQKSANLTGLKINQRNLKIDDKIRKIININNQSNGNIRIVVNQLRKDNRSEINLILSFIKHRYPNKQEILSGVTAQTFNAVRINPNAKTINAKLRSSLDNIIQFRKIYETILVNKNNYITEGSRSNIFFVKSDAIFTSPLSKVLPGITRQKVLEICRNANIKVVEDCINTRDLAKYEAVFISGTSPGILQLKQINKQKFIIEHPLIKYIRDQYNILINKNLTPKL